MKVSVSYLKSNCSKEKTLELLDCTTCDFIHVDLMDGCFAGEQNYEIEEVLKIFQNIQKPLDMHFMIQDPSIEIEQFAILNPNFMTIPVEISSVEIYLKKIKGLGIPCGLAINPDTPLETIVPYLETVDQILVMSVNPGKGGQPFQEKVLDKLKQLYSLKKEKDLSFVISIDGGINEETVSLVRPYVDMIVSGSFVCLSSDYQKQIDLLKKSRA